jgi:UDP-GlcNAc:undecaprenyl-phosphate GlcNAc-1-phosphate transferase
MGGGVFWWLGGLGFCTRGLELDLLIYLFVPFFISLGVTPLVIRFAVAIGCIDHPERRRVHAEATPRLGGMAFFAGITPVFMALGMYDKYNVFVFASLFLMFLGAVDDWKSLGWKVKLLGIILASAIVIVFGNITIESIGTFPLIGKVSMGFLAVPFTFLALVGMTNALNLIDGLNGLATGVSIFGFLFMGLAAMKVGNLFIAMLALGFVGALLGFLMYNFPKAQVFMGDSGSLFLGFSLGVTAIMLTQDEAYPVEPLYPVVVLLIPLFDTLRVMTVRAMQWRNPFRADKTHLHHLLTRSIFSQSQTVVFIWVLSLIFGLSAFFLVQENALPFFIVLSLSFVLLSLYTELLGRLRRRKKRHQPIAQARREA